MTVRQCYQYIRETQAKRINQTRGNRTEAQHLSAQKALGSARHCRQIRVECFWTPADCDRRCEEAIGTDASKADRESPWFPRRVLNQVIPPEKGMVLMKQDLTIAVRFPEEVAHWLERTANEEQEKHPESRITTSTIVRGIVIPAFQSAQRSLRLQPMAVAGKRPLAEKCAAFMQGAITVEVRRISA